MIRLVIHKGVNNLPNQQQVDLLKRGVVTWNQWKGEHPKIQVDLSWTELQGYSSHKVNTPPTRERQWYHAMSRSRPCPTHDIRTGQVGTRCGLGIRQAGTSSEPFMGDG